MRFASSLFDKTKQKFDVYIGNLDLLSIMLPIWDQFLQWITFDLFWTVMTLGILVDGLIALYIDSPVVPQFMRTLLLFGKFGKEPKLTKPTKESSTKESSAWVVLCDGINSVLKKLEVPKSWFRHFYIYLLVVWCLVVFNLLASKTEFFRNFSVGHLLLATQLMQSCRRIYETNFVSIYSGKLVKDYLNSIYKNICLFSDNSINFVHYLTGYLFYSSLGYVTYSSIKNSQSSNEFPGLSSWLFFSLFIFASYIQYNSHVILARLRTDKPFSEEHSQHNYHIPRAGLFRLITCPHYLAEILIYLSMYQLTPYTSSLNFSWLILVLFVIANQLVASLVTHRWYSAKFGDKFSPQVKAVIPFVL